MESAETIVAPASPPGRAAVAVFRISGPRTAQILREVAGRVPLPRLATLRSLRDPRSGAVVDRGIVLWFPGPESFTGEDMAELQVHGGRAISAGMIEAVLSIPRVRLAAPGEFTARAFANGKLDLTQIEGLADLINAETEAQRRQALAQSDGALSVLYEGWRTDLLAALASVEADLDFSDEGDVPEGGADRATELIVDLEAGIRAHLADAHRGERLREGFRVVIAGPPNAGKSSLLNVLARRDAAIVSAEAGTTRDLIEVHLDLLGFPVILTDTAGLRRSNSAVETEGVRRAEARAASADLVLWLIDATHPEPEPPGKFVAPDRVLRVLNKTDLPFDSALTGDGAAPISALTGAGVAELVVRLAERVAGSFAHRPEAPMPTRARHRVELEAAHAALVRFLDGLAAPPEARAEDLRLAAARLGRLTGRIDVEDVLGRIFSEFCIGK